MLSLNAMVAQLDYEFHYGNQRGRYRNRLGTLQALKNYCFLFGASSAACLFFVACDTLPILAEARAFAVSGIQWLHSDPRHNRLLSAPF
jgi:hypothetical protein